MLTRTFLSCAAAVPAASASAAAAAVQSQAFMRILHCSRFFGCVLAERAATGRPYEDGAVRGQGTLRFDDRTLTCVLPPSRCGELLPFAAAGLSRFSYHRTTVTALPRSVNVDALKQMA